MEKADEDRQIIIRFEHLFARNEDPILSNPVSINLDGLFNDVVILSLMELNLSANQLLKDKKSWQWNLTESINPVNDHSNGNIPPMNFEFVLNPMEIRTFLATVKRSM